MSEGSVRYQEQQIPLNVMNMLDRNSDHYEIQNTLAKTNV